MLNHLLTLDKIHVQSLYINQDSHVQPIANFKYVVLSGWKGTLFYFYIKNYTISYIGVFRIYFICILIYKYRAYKYYSFGPERMVTKLLPISLSLLLKINRKKHRQLLTIFLIPTMQRAYLKNYTVCIERRPHNN